MASQPSSSSSSSSSASSSTATIGTGFVSPAAGADDREAMIVFTSFSDALSTVPPPTTELRTDRISSTSALLKAYLTKRTSVSRNWHLLTSPREVIRFVARSKRPSSLKPGEFRVSPPYPAQNKIGSFSFVSKHRHITVQTQFKMHIFSHLQSGLLGYPRLWQKSQPSTRLQVD